MSVEKETSLMPVRSVLCRHEKAVIAIAMTAMIDNFGLEFLWNIYADFPVAKEHNKRRLKLDRNNKIGDQWELMGAGMEGVIGD